MILDILPPKTSILLNVKTLDFSIQIRKSEDNDEKLSYILYYIAIEVLGITEKELAFDLPKYTLRVENWKPLFCTRRKEKDESLKITFKEAVTKINAIICEIENWEVILAKTNDKINNSPVKLDIYFETLAIMQEGYNALNLENEQFLRVEIPSIIKNLENRIILDNGHSPSRDSVDLIIRCHDISTEKFEEHFQYFRRNTTIFKESKTIIETKFTKLNPTKDVGLFSSFKGHFNDLYKRIKEAKSYQGFMAYYIAPIIYGSPVDNSDPLHDYVIKDLHSIQIESIPNKKIPIQTTHNEPSWIETNIDIKCSEIYKTIKKFGSEECVLAYLGVRNFMKAIEHVGGGVKLTSTYSIIEKSYRHLDVYQQILLWERMPDILKSEELSALKIKAECLLGTVKSIIEETDGWTKFISKVMAEYKIIEGEEGDDFEEKDLLNENLIQSSIPAYRLAVLRVCQKQFSAVSVSQFQPLLQEISPIQEQLQGYIASAKKESISDASIELIAHVFDITEGSLFTQFDYLHGFNSKIKQVDTELTIKFNEMCDLVTKFKVYFNETLYGVIAPEGGMDIWFQNQRTSPIDTPNILKLEKVVAFIETLRGGQDI